MSRNLSVTNPEPKDRKSVTGIILDIANAAATDIGIIPSNQLEDLNTALESKDAFQAFQDKQKARAELLRGTVLFAEGDVDLTFQNYAIGRSFRTALNSISAVGESGAF